MQTQTNTQWIRLVDYEEFSYQPLNEKSHLIEQVIRVESEPIDLNLKQ